jgi:hypothetical protein
MSNKIFPAAVRGLAYSVLKAPEESTIVQQAINAAEVRIANWQNPIWHWELIYTVLFDVPGNIAPGLTVTDLKAMMGFYLARQGRFDSFLYSDPTDNHVNPDDQELALIVANGTYYSPIQRAMGEPGDQFFEDITDFDGPLSLYANGVLQITPSDYTLLGPGVALPGYSFDGYVAQWVGTPTGPITADFSFFFRVRFEMDKLAFEEFVNNLWTLGGSESSGSDVLKLVSARVPMV